MRKLLCTVLVLTLFLTSAVYVYAAGPKEPTIESEMPDCYVVLGEHVLTLYTDATSPDGGMLEYQWYSTTVNDIATIRAIDEATGGTYTPPQKVGVMYYCYAVWNIKSGIRSSPVYSRLIRVEYADPTPTVESIEILTVPNKVVYTSGECLDLTGLKVRIWTSEGYIDSVNGDNLEIAKNPLVTLGEQKIKVSYQGVYDFFIVTVKAAAHTHSFGAWMVTTKPTCTEGGIKMRECDCGYTERSEIPAAGHQWDDGKITKEPTESAEGEKTFTCTVCKKTKTETIKAIQVATEPSASTSDPSESTSVPSESTSVPSESTDVPSESTTVPSESTAEPSESVVPVVETPEKHELSFRFPWWTIALVAALAIGSGVVVLIVLIVLKKKKR